MYKVSFVLPCRQHDGTANGPIIDEIEQYLARTYGGWTAVQSVGGWLDPMTGGYYTDQALTVFTFVDSQSLVDELLCCAQQWARDLQQIELLVMVEVVDVYHIPGTRAQARVASQAA